MLNDLQVNIMESTCKLVEHTCTCKLLIISYFMCIYIIYPRIGDSVDIRDFKIAIYMNG